MGGLVRGVDGTGWITLVGPPASGFLGAPVETDLTRLEADIAILGVPFGWPYPRRGTTAGCTMAPTVVRRRAARLARFRDHWEFDFDGPMHLPRMADAGDVPGDATDGPGNSAQTTAAVAAILERGHCRCASAVTTRCRSRSCVRMKAAAL